MSSGMYSIQILYKQTITSYKLPTTLSKWAPFASQTDMGLLDKRDASNVLYCSSVGIFFSEEKRQLHARKQQQQTRLQIGKQLSTYYWQCMSKRDRHIKKLRPQHWKNKNGSFPLPRWLFAALKLVVFPSVVGATAEQSLLTREMLYGLYLVFVIISINDYFFIIFQIWPLSS